MSTKIAQGTEVAGNLIMKVIKGRKTIFLMISLMFCRVQQSYEIASNLMRSQLKSHRQCKREWFIRRRPQSVWWESATF